MTNNEIMNAINQMELKNSQVEALSANGLECWVHATVEDWYNNHDNDETPIILWLYNWNNASEKYIYLEDADSVILHDYIGVNGINLYQRNKILALRDNYVTNILS